MRKNLWGSMILAMILSVMFMTVSCAKKMVQSEPEPMTQSEVSKAPEKPAEDIDRSNSLQDDRIQAEANAREAAGKAFVDENIYFAFDSAVLSDQAQQMLNIKADYLRANPEITVTVEGHCDERGTNAYNIALGERRAGSVKNFLVDLGIGTNRLGTVSYGEERPADKGQNEAAWAKNRRAQFVIN